MEDENRETEELIEQLEAQQGACCRGCGQRLCGHQVLASIALGAKSAPRCVECLAKVMGETAADLARSLFNYFEGRSCYWAAWTWASKQEGVDPGRIPSCMR